MNGEGLRELARFAARTDARTLPPEVVAKGKACLLYGMAVGIACMRVAQPAQAARATAGAGTGAATRFFDDAKCDAGLAAFANGVLFHSRVQDDAHPAGHVGVVVIPAALAMAETLAADGADLIAALVAGYETALRIGRDHAADLSARGFRTTPMYGVFGAAAAAGRLLGFDERTMTHALALAANMAGGLREYSESGSEDFPFHAGTAAGNGIMAARLAAAGATSGPTALDGKAGFFRAYGERDATTRPADRGPRQRLRNARHHLQALSDLPVPSRNRPRLLPVARTRGFSAARFRSRFACIRSRPISSACASQDRSRRFRRPS